MLKVGETAPDFTLMDDQDNQTRLSDIRRNGPLILYFYPADFTPGCTREACSLRDLHTDFVKSGVSVYGVSPQSTESHRRFRDKYQLPFRLLSDPDKQVIALYGAQGPMGFGVQRISYLINKQGQIQAALKANFRIAEHTQFFKEAISI
jgi:peroxiredoxin Q/BCP